MSPPPNPGRLLHRKTARAAGGLCTALALLAAAATATLLATWRDADTVMRAHLGAWVALWILLAVAGVQLIRGNTSAQRFLLAVWLLVAVATALALLTGLVGDGTAWTPPVPPWVVASALLVAATVAVALLVVATVDRTPLRYGAYVSVSAAVAVALVIAVNLIAHDTYWRRDVQQLGRFGLSARTRTILATLQSPVRLTCVYTSTDPRTPASEYRPAVLELLADMREQNSQIEVDNAATESAKAAVVARLRGRVGGQAEEHVAFLNAFATEGDDLAAALRTEQARWAQLPEESYVAMWAMTAQVPQLLDKLATDTEHLAAKITSELSGSGLPDYAGLADEAEGILDNMTSDLGAEARLLGRIATIPAAVSQNRRDAAAKLQAMLQAVVRLNATLAGTPPSEASGKFLETVAAQARAAAEAARQAAKALRQAAGADNARLLAASQYYQLTIPTGIFEVRADLPRFIEQYIAASLDEVAETAETVRQVAKPDYYGRSAAKMQTESADLVALSEKTTQAGEKALGKLAEVDEPSQAVLQLAEAGQMFQGPLTTATELLERVRALPELTGASLSEEIAGENIVIIETEGETAVVPFDEVWPMRQAWVGAAAAGGEDRPRRTFRGDAAIASRLLAMTSEPFATVVITYYGGAPGMERRTPPADIEPYDLTALRKRLEEANFEVVEWNLAAERPAENPDRPQVLLVLPPPPAPPPGLGQEVPGFGDEHVAKVAAAIDDGTPAIFLAQFLWPRQMPFMPPVSPTYGFGDYLRRTWGIDVRTDCLVIPAVSDETQPGRYKIAPARFRYAPLSTFSDHPIGRPLQAQRVLWTAMAPILKTASVPAGVEVEQVLAVPTSWQATWATSRLAELQAELDTPGATLRPDYAAGDIAPPFAVAVAATRSIPRPTTPTTAASSQPASAPSVTAARIVAMTLGAGMVDGYLDHRVGQLDARNTLVFTDPPRANADVVVNSVYWLIGREGLISAGPARVQPVAMLSASTMNLLRVIYLVGLPAAVVMGGAAVLLARRR